MDFGDIKEHIRQFPEHFNLLWDSERSNIINHSYIRILESMYLFNLWENRTNKNDFFVIKLAESCIETLSFSHIDSAVLNHLPNALKLSNEIEVNEKFEIVNKSYTTIDRQHIETESNKRKVVFFFGESGIDVAVRGKLAYNNNFFYNEDDMSNFSKKYHISELEKCINDYEKHLKSPGQYKGFFVDKQLIELHKLNKRNVLRNTPENHLRNHLKDFLNANTKHYWDKEPELDSRDELDLFTEADFKKYCIEVKWVGQSINKDCNGLSKKFGEDKARDGVVQLLGYIKELIEDMKVNFKTGFLCVFDVREDKSQDIDYKGYSFLINHKHLIPYYENNFVKLKDIKLDNLDNFKS